MKRFTGQDDKLAYKIYTLSQPETAINQRAIHPDKVITV